ncbi:hypothetical protein AB0D42_25050 [Streptomyces sp. NPDC048304]|uniref:hypothetical protein n=1 Tax=Streptomyces sp. NPDC048304 TaxID=3154820 RepID=UPI0033E3E1F2
MQCSVESALASITVAAPKDPVRKDDYVTLVATGDQISGDDIALLTIRIAESASHVPTWNNSEAPSR